MVSIDEDGFIAIRGRLKRFAKIGGETVSLAVVENCASALWPDNAHAAVAVPDGAQGRADRAGHRCPEAPRGWIWWPGRRITASPNWRCRAGCWWCRAIPVLGTGKTDYVSVQKHVERELAQAAT